MEHSAQPQRKSQNRFHLVFRTSVLTLLCAVVSASAYAGAKPSLSRFENIINQQYGSNLNPADPKGMAAGKLTSSGFLDVVVADENMEAFLAFFGKGDGSFSTPVTIGSVTLDKGKGAGGIATAVTIGDVNGDGINDVVGYDTRAIYVIIGHGDGTFDTPVTYDCADASELLLTGGVAIGDVNGDGLPDITLAANVFDESSELQVFVNNGSGLFSGPVVSAIAGGGATGLALADFDGDGILDAAVTSEATGVDLEVARGNGDGSFTEVYSLTTPATDYGVQVADFNADGKLDLAAANFNGAVEVLFGNGDGTFQTPTYYNVPKSAAGIALGDFNRDGKLDIAAGFEGSKGDGVFIIPATCSGTFGAQVTAIGHPSGDTTFPVGVAVGFFNCDGNPNLCGIHSPDIVTVDQQNNLAGGVTTHLNR